MTVELQNEEKAKVVTVRVSGKLSKKDYEAFVPEIERQMERHGKVRILFDMHDFHGWELGAAWEDLKFGVKHFKDVERLAMVGEKTWEKWMSSFCKPFTRAEVRYYDRSEAEAAKAWIEG